jgi:hypothetical protein
VVFLATAAAVTAGRLPLDVSFDELVNHPDKYNGKHIAVRAYLVTSCAHCRDLWASVQAARDSRVHASSVENWILMGDFNRKSAVPKGFLDSVKVRPTMGMFASQERSIMCMSLLRKAARKALGGTVLPTRK